jgi:PhoPQ-activated pathogenicity-related protein
MTRLLLCCLVVAVLAAAAVAVPLSSAAAPLRKYARTGATRTALDDYVDKPDDHYNWEVIKEEEGLGFKAVFLNMTSQKWLNETLVDRPIWWHVLVLFIPHDLRDKENAFLYITGGGNSPDLCELTDQDCAVGGGMALSSGTITGVLFQVPNEALQFLQEPGSPRRSEDGIIAYTWWHFLNNPSEPEWLLRLPMTKAAVRALDTIQAYADQEMSLNVEKFVVAGASKRGWTTWTTGIVDTRVQAIVPMVMDLLNFKKSCHHHYRSLGGWTFAFGDYYALNFTMEIDNPNLELMADIIDPYSYLDRLTMPKMVMTSSGDEFFLPDDSHYWFKDMPGETHMRVVGNAEHSLSEHIIEELSSIEAFYLGVIRGEQRPRFSWDLDEVNGRIVINATDKPDRIKMYHARTLSKERRDFRLVIAGVDGGEALQPVLWGTETLEPQENGLYVASKPTPDYGWGAFFAQLEYDRGDHTYIFSTETCIVPNVFPFPECEGVECKGTLV